MELRIFREDSPKESFPEGVLQTELRKGVIRALLCVDAIKIITILAHNYFPENAQISNTFDC